MRIPWFTVVSLLSLMAGCGALSSTKPVEVLDERTGVTVASLKEPIELLPSVQNPGLAIGKRPSFAYLGPAEWNRSGAISYGLWVHVAPGNDRQLSDIRAPDAVTLVLDDGPLALSTMDAPKLGRDAYQPVASWGQTAYFELTVETLKRMAASQKLELDVRAADNSTMVFFPSHDTRATLSEYLHGRGIADD